MTIPQFVYPVYYRLYFSGVHCEAIMDSTTENILICYSDDLCVHFCQIYSYKWNFWITG